MSKHTPGPWNVSANRITAGGFAASDGVAHIMNIPAGEGSYEIERANARLIAAAPEMLEALKVAEKIAYRYAGVTRVTSELSQAITQIEAAIAKAEGKQ